MRARILVMLVVIAVLTFSLRELACVAAEHPLPAAPAASVETSAAGRVDLRLPTAPEVDVRTAFHPALTF